MVVGGGVIGLSCAYFLARSGCEVTVLEGRVMESPNCSTGNAGMVVPSHFIPLATPGVIGQGLRWMLKPESPFSIRPSAKLALWRWAWQFYRACSPSRVKAAKPILRDLSLASRTLFERLAEEEGLEFQLVQRGLLALCKKEETLRHESTVVDQGRVLGIDAEVLDSKAVNVLDPGVTMDVAGAVYFHQDCHLNPAAFRLELIRRLEEMGGKVHWESKVTGVEHAQGRVHSVSTADGNAWHADGFVMAGGVWTTTLGEQLGVSLPMQGGKGYSMTLTSPRQLPEICSLLMEARVAVTPMGGKLRIGGTMEIGGKEGVINEAKVRGITKSVPNYFPEFQASDFEGQETWTGLRPCTPDGLPYLGRCPGLANTFIAAGHAMLGLSLSPISGWLICQMVNGETPDVDVSLLDPGRY
jgi:D-amino-acid dehydrogenase